MMVSVDVVLLRKDSMFFVEENMTTWLGSSF